MKAAALISSGLLVPLLVLAIPAAAATWNVTFDPSDNVDQIGSVVAQTANGDTILVGPGTYYEHIDLQGKSLTLRSTSGPETTILDGSLPPGPGASGSIVYSGPFGTGTVALVGLTLQNGTGGLNDLEHSSGGAVCFWNESSHWAGEAEIRDCIIADNSLPASGALRWGGGIALKDIYTGRIADCSFRGNETSFGHGGAICLLDGYPVVEDCTFQVDPGSRLGDAIYISTMAPVRIERCNFTSDGSLGEDWCIFALIGDIHLIDNTFVARNGSIAARVALYEMYGTGDDYTTVELAGTRLLSEGASPSGVIEISFARGIAHVTGNTLVNCATSVRGYSSDTVELSNNLLVHSPTTVESSWHGGTARCNNAWPDQIVDLLGNVTFDRNIAEDPLFCGLDQRSFDVSAFSVCAEGNSPDGCGWIGAGRIGCGGTPVRPATWGQIKALFR